MAVIYCYNNMRGTRNEGNYQRYFFAPCVMIGASAMCKHAKATGRRVGESLLEGKLCKKLIIRTA